MSVFDGPASRPLTVPMFRRLWLAAIVSNLGTFAHTVAASWSMLQMTSSPLWVGLMVASSTLPLLLFALPAGAMSDLSDRRRILVATHMLMALAAAVTAVAAYLGVLGPASLLALGLLIGTGQAFTMPSWQALVPELVGNEHVADAVALNSAGFNVSRAIGPALGGVVVATAGPEFGFALNAVSFVPVVAAVATLPRRALPRDGESIPQAILSGIRYARWTPSYRWLLAIAMSFGLTSGALQALLPNLTSDRLGGGSLAYGVLLGAMGVGAMVGAFTRRKTASRLRRLMVPVSIAMFGAAMFAVAAAPRVALAALAIAVAGVAWVWVLATLNATVQLLSPGWVRGRIMSLYTLSFVGMLPVGSIVAGALADRHGVATVLSLDGLVVIALGLVAARLPLPVLERVVSPQAPTGYEPPPHPQSVASDRVMVVTTWSVDDRDLDEFYAVMDELRLVRLRTGARRWRLYRDVEEPGHLSEVFVLRSWEEHLRQHRRIDIAGLEVLQRARAFDTAGGPTTRHLAAVAPPESRRAPSLRVLAAHEALHREQDPPPDADDGDREPVARTAVSRVRLLSRSLR